MREAGRGHYILIWFLTTVLSGIVSTLLTLYIFRLMEPASAVMFSAIIGSISLTLVWVFIYSLNKTLIIKKVMPWLWGFAGLGTLSNITREMRTLQEFGLEHLTGQYLITMTFAYVLFVWSFGKYFMIYKPEHYGGNDLRPKNIDDAPITNSSSELNKNNHKSDTQKPYANVEFRKGQTKAIFSPGAINYGEGCKIIWSVREGDVLKRHDLLFEIEVPDGKNIKIKADDDFLVDKINQLPGTLAGNLVTKPYQKLGQVTRLKDAFSIPKAEDCVTNNDLPTVSTSKPDNQIKEDAQTVTAKLRKIKKLKEDGLISEEAWQRKQSEILDNL